MDIQTMKMILNNHQMDEKIVRIVNTNVENEKKRYLDILKECENIYGEGDYRLYSSPARSELCGNHTDHQHGRVITACINTDMIALVKINHRNIVSLSSTGFEMKDIDLFECSFQKEEVSTSAGLIRGIANEMKNRGINIQGFEGCIQSNIKSGSGMSSSAAFEVLIAMIFNDLYNDNQLSEREIAKICQYSENNYYKKASGLMDQMSICYGGCISMDFKDPCMPEIQKLDFDFKRYGYRLVLVHTQGSHNDLSNEYGYIPSEMKLIASLQGEDVLRECDKNAFVSHLSKLRKCGNDRALLRAYHFFKEDERVGLMIQAILKHEITDVLKIMKESGLSSNMYLQNIYSSMKVMHQSLNLALAMSEDFLRNDGIVRVHGGGFEGCILAIVKEECVEKYCHFMQRIFTEDSTFLFDVRTKGACRII